jgi:hypothetical protein
MKQQLEADMIEFHTRVQRRMKQLTDGEPTGDIATRE